MTWGRRAWIGLAVVLVASQLRAVERTNPPVRGDLAAEPAVHELLRRACYDCHSNETRWPWYSAVAPMSWLIAHDVEEGRRRLDFSEWSEYASDPETAAQKLRQVAESVTGGDMAPRYYRVLHSGARLTAEERSLIARWATEEIRRVSSDGPEGKQEAR
jgi:heme-binding protein